MQSNNNKSGFGSFVPKKAEKSLKTVKPAAFGGNANNLQKKP